MHKRTKACSIKAAVKKRVEERDGHCCIFCGRPGRGEAHVISRAHGGLGVEQNLITICRECHFLLDDTVSRPLMLEMAKQHLKKFYPDWSADAVIYKKGIETKALGSWSNKKLVNNTSCYLESNKNLKKTEHEGFYLIEEETDEDNRCPDDPADV